MTTKHTIEVSGTAIQVSSFKAVIDELHRASKKNLPFNSAHEGYAVLKEEVDEMWDEIKTNNIVKAREEAIQVAAMAIRFLCDV